VTDHDLPTPNNKGAHNKDGPDDFGFSDELHITPLTASDGEVTRVSLKDAFQLRRILRRLLGLKNRAGLVTFRIFVRDEHIQRLMRLLGYPPLG
jgi:hypothetical protein